MICLIGLRWFVPSGGLMLVGLRLRWMRFGVSGGGGCATATVAAGSGLGGAVCGGRFRCGSGVGVAP